MAMLVGVLGTGLWSNSASADVASPYRGQGIYYSSGAGAWHGLYVNLPGLPAGRAAACTFQGGGEPDSFRPNGVYARTGSNSSNGASLTVEQLAFAFARYGRDGSQFDGEALDALVAQNILGQPFFLSPSGTVSFQTIVAAAKKYRAVVPTVSGLVTSPAGRADTTYTATVAGDPGTTYALSAAGARLQVTSVTTTASGRATLRYSVPSTNTSHNFSVRVSGTIYSGMDQYAAVDQPPQQSQTVATWITSPVSSLARGSVEPLVSASVTKLTAGDAAKRPQAATFKVIDKTTGVTLTSSFKTLAGRPTPLLAGFTPCHVFIFDELGAPSGDYVPSSPFTVTVPCNASDGFAIVLTDPRIPVITIGTVTNYIQTPYSVRLTDQVSLTGDDGEGGLITGSLKRLPGVRCAAATAGQWAAAAPVGSYTTPIVARFGDGRGNGTYTVTGPVPTAAQPGAWGWFETARLTPSGATARSPYGAPNECTDVTRPAAATQVSESSGLVGDQLVDTIDVTGVSQLPAASAPIGTIASTLYAMPFPSDTAQCPIPGSAAGALAWAAFIQKANPAAAVASQSHPVSADMSFVTTPYRVTTPGCYTYATTYTPASNDGRTLAGRATGGAGQPLVIGAPGSVGESSVIIAPRVTTLIQHGPAAGRSTVRFADQASIAGTHGVATTLVDKLIGPAKPDTTGSCSHAVYSAAAVAGVFAPVTVTSDQTVTTNQVSIAKQASAACFIGWEALTIAGPNGQPRTAYTAPLGTEMAEMSLLPARASGAAAGGGYVIPPTPPHTTVNTGRPGPGSVGPGWARWAGGAGLGTAVAGLGLLLRRRRMDLP